MWAHKKACKKHADASNSVTRDGVLGSSYLPKGRQPKDTLTSQGCVAVHNQFMQHSIGLILMTSPWRRKQKSAAKRRRLLWIELPILALLLGLAGCLKAQPLQDKQQEEDPSFVPLAMPAEAALQHQASVRKKPRLRGALTAVVGWGPDYLGAASSGLSYKPGFLLQYGRWSLSSRGSFAASADALEGEELPRGLGFNLLGDEQDWLRMSLRVDSGRRSKGVPGLMGIDDVPRTLRMRLSGQVSLPGAWALTPAVHIDLLNRGVGHTLQLDLSRRWALTPRAKLDVHMGFTWGTGQYMNSYFGVTAAEALASRYASYHATAGLRDVRASVGLHYEINPRWVATINTGLQHLVGPAARSPITQSTTLWGLGAGLGWRF
jgi:MipA family protein